MLCTQAEREKVATIFRYSSSVTLAFSSPTGRLASRPLLKRVLRQLSQGGRAPSRLGHSAPLNLCPHHRTLFYGSFLRGGKASPPTGAVAGRYDIAEWGWNFGYDPDDSSLLACDQIPPKGQNFTFYCNPALDALYTQELATADAGVRQQIFQQIHQIYLAQLPFITLYSPKLLSIVRKGTHNYLPGHFSEDTVNIWEWWCDGGKC